MLVIANASLWAARFKRAECKSILFDFILIDLTLTTRVIQCGVE